MAQYLIQGETLTAIGDEVRELSGVTDALSPSTMTTNLNASNTEIATQTNLISQITTALEGKAAGGSSGTSVETVTGVFSNSTEAAGVLYYTGLVDGVITSLEADLTNSGITPLAVAVGASMEITVVKNSMMYLHNGSFSNNSCSNISINNLTCYATDNDFVIACTT